MSPHPRRGARPVVVALALLTALTTTLTTATFLAAPAEARSRTATSVAGWTTTGLTLTQGQAHGLRVQLRGRHRAARNVVLQLDRRDVGWRTVRRATTGRGGAAILRVPTTSPYDGRVRVVVAPTRRSRGATTSPRRLVVQRTAAVGTPAPTGSMTSEEAEVLRLVNEARSVARRCGDRAYPAVGPVTAAPRLVTTSREHARDMGEKNYFSHTSADGRSPWDRARAAGYDSASGENIAAGYWSPADVMGGWLDSPGHCSNIMAADARELGVGMALVHGSTYGIYWVQMFGRG